MYVRAFSLISVLKTGGGFVQTAATGDYEFPGMREYD